jgi:hypothetical protein
LDNGHVVLKHFLALLFAFLIATPVLADPVSEAIYRASHTDTSIREAIWRAQPLPLLKAWTHGKASIVPPPTCPQVIDGGCAESPGGAFLAATYFSTPTFYAHAAQAGQVWAGGAHPPTFNACGVDYACGYYTALASLSDPSLTQPANCAYSTYESVPALTCTDNRTGTGFTISTYNFGLHGCIPLYIYNSTGPIVIGDNAFIEGANCSTIGPFAVTSGTYNSGTGIVTLQVASSPAFVPGDNLYNATNLIGTGSIASANVDAIALAGTNSTQVVYQIATGLTMTISSGGAQTGTWSAGNFTGNQLQIKVNADVSSPITFTSNELFGNMYVYTVGGQACLTDNGSGSYTSTYNVYLQCPGRPVAFNSSGAFSSKYDYCEDFSNDGSHGECQVMTYTGTQSAITYQYDTMVATNNMIANCCTSFIFSGAGAGGQTVTQITIDHNWMVINPGASSTFTLSTAIEFPSNTVTNSAITNNYIDGTGLEVANRNYSTYATCTHATTFSGNIDLVSGASINAWSSVGGGRGC